MNILMCEPKYYDLNYEINPWMNRKMAVHKNKAQLQWEALKLQLQSCHIHLDFIPAVPEFPDLVFTANAALILGETAYLSHFRYPERQGESAFNKAWFVEHQFLVDDFALAHQCYFEGAGDVLLAGNDRIFAGYGFRSDLAYYHYLDEVTAADLIYCELVDPYFYHLDTCFCPLDANTALWWPAAFSPRAQLAMRSAIDLIDVSFEEAKRFACNAIVCDQKILMPSGCTETQKRLEDKGFEVFVCEMSEFIKSGGACKCLVLNLGSTKTDKFADDKNSVIPAQAGNHLSE